MNLHDALRFIACRDCGELQPVHANALTRSDAAGEAALNAYNDFLARHRAHRLACFHRYGSESVSDRPFWDPMATITFEVTDGERAYVVQAGRQSIDDERRYRFFPGALEVENSEVHIRPSDLRHALDRQFYPHALRPTKVDRFLSAVRDVISQIDPDELAIAFDAADDPTVSIARMPEAIFDDLLARCADIFDPWELPRVVSFLGDNRREDGLLALRIRRPLAVLPV